MSNEKLKQLVSYYKQYVEGKPKSHFELEMAIKGIDQALFQMLFKKLSKDEAMTNGRLICSLDVKSLTIAKRLQTEPSQYIRTIYFNTRGEKTKEEYSEKRQLCHPLSIREPLTYTTKLSEEIPLDKFPLLCDNIICRFKARVSFDFMYKDKKWSIDLTAVKTAELNSIKTQLEDFKRKFFVGLTYDNFIEKLNYDMITSYEVELEHIDPKTVSLMTLDDLTVINEIWLRIDEKFLNDSNYQTEIYNIAAAIMSSELAESFKNPKYRLKKLGNAVIAITKDVYYKNIFPPTADYVAVKIDGIRTFISIDGPKLVMLNNDISIMINPSMSGGLYIFDCEMIVEDNKPTQLYLLDCLCFNSKNITKEGFNKRLTYLEDGAALISKFIKSKGKSGEYIIAPQDYRLIGSNIKKTIMDLMDTPRTFIIDGLIITEPNDSYKNTKNYKWKPMEDNTVDFIALKLPLNYINQAPYIEKKGKTLYILMCGIAPALYHKIGKTQLPMYEELVKSLGRLSADYFPTHFISSVEPLSYLFYSDDNNLHGKIIELKKDESEHTDQFKWELKNIRHDRANEKDYYGNDYRIAELTFINFVDEFKLEHLWEKPINYIEVIDVKFSNTIHYINNATYSAVRNYSNNATLIVDIFPTDFTVIEAPNIVYIDSNTKKIAEIITHKFQHTTKTNISAMVKDIRGLKQWDITDASASLILCNNFQVMGTNTEYIKTFLKLTYNTLAVGGYCIFICLDGEQVFNNKDVNDKYPITRNYKADKFTIAGQEIIVMDTPQYLVNVDAIVKESESNGFALINKSPLLTYGNKTKYDLSEDDLKFLEMMVVIVLVK